MGLIEGVDYGWDVFPGSCMFYGGTGNKCQLPAVGWLLRVDGNDYRYCCPHLFGMMKLSMAIRGYTWPGLPG